MNFYREISHPIGVVTFKDLLDYGGKNSKTLSKGFPLSIKYKGLEFVRKTNTCYVLDDYFKITNKHVLIFYNGEFHGVKTIDSIKKNYKKANTKENKLLNKYQNKNEKRK